MTCQQTNKMACYVKQTKPFYWFYLYVNHLHFFKNKRLASSTLVRLSSHKTSGTSISPSSMLRLKDSARL